MLLPTLLSCPYSKPAPSGAGQVILADGAHSQRCPTYHANRVPTTQHDHLPRPIRPPLEAYGTLLLPVNAYAHLWNEATVHLRLVRLLYDLRRLAHARLPRSP